MKTHSVLKTPPLAVQAMTLAFALSLASCPGNGGAALADGETYTGDGGQTAASASALSVDSIAGSANSDSLEGLVQLVTSAASGDEAESASRIGFSASDLGLPEGGSVTLTLTVDGRERVYKATASGDGSVYFDIPGVQVGSAVTVKMDVRDSSGALVLTGKKSKTVTADDSSLAVVLSDKVDVSLTVDFAAVSAVYLVNVGGAAQLVAGTPRASFTAPIGSTATVQYAFALGDDGKLYDCSPAAGTSLTSVSVKEHASATLAKPGYASMSRENAVTFAVDDPSSVAHVYWQKCYPSNLDAFEAMGLVSMTAKGDISYKAPASSTWTSFPAEYGSGAMLPSGASARMTVSFALGGVSRDWTVEYSAGD